jgi:peptide-methionine (R)-S-oxide reductase
MFEIARSDAASKIASALIPVTLSSEEAHRDIFRSVTMTKGTDPFSSKLDFDTRAGTYACSGCDLPVFSSATKYDSHTGWPSFWQPLEQAVAERDDTSFGMARTEIHRVRCGGHLGHVYRETDVPPAAEYGVTPGGSLRSRMMIL